MYQLIKSTSFGGISVEESLSLSFLQEKMRKDFQEITKMKSVSASELSDKAAFIHAGAECYHWLIREDCCKVPVRGGFLEASEINDPDYPGISVDFTRADGDIMPLALIEQKENHLRAVVYTKMYKEEPEYNEPFEYDSEMIRNLCFSSYIQDDNSVKYPKNLSYKKFCQTVFEDRMYMKEILSNEEYRSYENYLQMAENGYLPE